MHGASLTYNLMLARAQRNEELTVLYAERFAKWASLIERDSERFSRWRLSDLIASYLYDDRAHRTRLFVSEWQTFVSAATADHESLRSLPDDPHVQRVIRDAKAALRALRCVSRTPEPSSVGAAQRRRSAFLPLVKRTRHCERDRSRTCPGCSNRQTESYSSQRSPPNWDDARPRHWHNLHPRPASLLAVPLALTFANCEGADGEPIPTRSRSRKAFVASRIVSPFTLRRAASSYRRSISGYLRSFEDSVVEVRRGNRRCVPPEGLGP